MNDASTDNDVRVLEALVLRNPWLAEVLNRFDEIALPDCWLVAGAIAQTVWNLHHRRAPEAGIKDIDIVYFDANDLSAAARHRQESRVRALFTDIPAEFDVHNEARVHLWYEERFGYPIAPYRSAEDAIATFPTTSSSVGVRRRDGRFECLAPFGLDDLLGFVVRPNKRQITREIYEAKLHRWNPIWPNLTYVPWEDCGERH